MPWEHVVIGYIGYSLFVRLFYRDTPTTTEAGIVVFASLFPDLVDKPLAWQLDVFASGHAIAHSLFVAIPISLAVLLLAWRRGTPRSGLAFALGYLLHLPADVIPQHLRTGESYSHRVLWPLRDGNAGYSTGFTEEMRDNMTGYFQWIGAEVSSGNPDPYLLVLLGVTGLGILLWIADGMPIGYDLYTLLKQRFSKLTRE